MFSSTVACAYSNVFFFFLIVHENTYEPIGYWLFYVRFAAATPNYENFTDDFHDISRAGFTMTRLYTLYVYVFFRYSRLYYYSLYYWLFMYLLSQRFTRCAFSRTRIVRQNTVRSTVGVVKNDSSVVYREEAAHTTPRRRRITNAHINGIFKNNKQS